MMNNNGFTLIELIGVILLLAILSIIVFPNVLTSINKNKDAIDEDSKNLIISSAREYVASNTDLFVKKTNNTYCIKLSTLYNNGYVDNVTGLKNSDTSLTTDAVKLVYNGSKFVYSYTTVSSCSGQTY